MAKLKMSLKWKIKLKNFGINPVKFLNKDLIFASSGEQNKKTSPFKVNDYWYLISTKGEIQDMMPVPEGFIGKVVFIPNSTNTKMFFQKRDKTLVELSFTNENKFFEQEIDEIQLPSGFIDNSKIILQDSLSLDILDQFGHLNFEHIVFGRQGFVFFLEDQQSNNNQKIKTHSAYQYYSYTKRQIFPFRSPSKRMDIYFPSWNQAGTKLAYGTDNRRLFVYDTVEELTKKVSGGVFGALYHRFGRYCWFGNNYIYTQGKLINVNNQASIKVGLKFNLGDSFREWGGVYYYHEIHPEELILSVVYKDTLKIYNLPEKLLSQVS